MPTIRLVTVDPTNLFCMPSPPSVAPVQLPPAKPSEQEAAVQAVKSLDSLEIIGKLLYNCAVTPKDDKFRRIKLSNKKIAELIVNTPNALDALKAFGWVHDRTNADELVVPSGLYFSMKEVRVIEVAKDKLRKDMRSNSSNRLSSMVSVNA
eukprot:jgi/Chrzof1/11349/Cz05g33100.t1